jgi:4-amino-4-deoxy-L-arabinose transferase-like glycosyltransferase
MTQRPWLTVVVWASALLLPFLAARSWWFPDEPDVALPVIEMAERGDWVVPTHNGVRWLDYQPLIYWSALAVSRVAGGVTEWTTRLPDALAAMLLVLAATWFWQRWRNREGSLDASPVTPLAAAGILLGMPLIVWQGVNAHPDMLHAAAITIGLLVYGLAGDGPRGWAWRMGAFAAFGLAWLAKGPPGLLLPGLVLTLWHIANRQWLRLLALAPLALVTFAVVAIWYVPLCARLGFEDVWREFQAQNFDRFAAGTNRGHGGKPVWYFATSLLVDAAPWSLLIIPAVIGAWRRRWADPLWRLLTLWFLAYLIFFTLAATKRNVYLLPAFAPVALLIADWLYRLDDGRGWERRWWSITAWGLAGLLAALGILLVMAGLSWERVLGMPWIATPLAEEDALTVAQGLAPGVMLAGAVLALGGGVMVRWLRQGAPALPIALVLSLSLGLAWMAAQALILPRFDEARSYRPACVWLDARLPAGARLGYHDPGRENLKRAGFLTYLRGHPLEFLPNAEAVSAFLAADPAALVVVPERIARDLPGAEAATIARFTPGWSWLVLGGAAQVADTRRPDREISSP